MVAIASTQKTRTVGAYLSAMATGRPAKLATIRRRLATIGYAHRCAKHDSPADDPAVKATMAGIARTIGSARTKKTALTAALVICRTRFHGQRSITAQPHIGVTR